MIIALWITALILTLVFVVSGGLKVVRTKDALEPQMAYVVDFAAWQMKVIGIVEVIGALGVVLPLVTGIAPVLTAVAALGLALVQVVAFIVHVRRDETKQSLPLNGGLFLLAVVVAVLRFLTL